MKYKLLRKEDYKTTKWSGGATTELYICPENAEYKERDFLFRISTATVECEQSVFTKLDNIKRKLMILEGEMKLNHKGKYDIELKKFEKDSFSGEDETTSFGIATDFNLMTNPMCSGDIEHICILKKSNYAMYLTENEEYEKNIECLYNLGEKITLSFQDEQVTLEKNEFIVMDVEKDDSKAPLKILNDTNKDIDLIHVAVNAIGY